MSESTNKLVTNSKRFVLPAAAIVLAGGMLFQHSVHAAAPAASGLDDASVASLTSLDNAVEAVAARVSPEVVNVAVTSKGAEHETSREGDDSDGGGLPPGFAQFFGQGGGRGGMRMQPQQPQIEHGIGSGVIISPDGYIVTNNHVVDGAVNIKVTLNDRRVLTGKVIGVDKLTDLAVIKVNATGLPSISWGDSGGLKPGQTVLAFGSPFGYFQNSVTRGIVSAVNRQNPYSDDARKPSGFIQTDAAINPGNSGGALVDAHGQLVGINTFIISNSGSFAGAGFAIPSQLARSVTTELIKSGKIEHGYLGVSIEDVTPQNASFFKLNEATGAIISQVTARSEPIHNQRHAHLLEQRNLPAKSRIRLTPRTKIPMPARLRDNRPRRIDPRPRQIPLVDHPLQRKRRPRRIPHRRKPAHQRSLSLRRRHQVQVRRVFPGLDPRHARHRNKRMPVRVDHPRHQHLAATLDHPRPRPRRNRILRDLRNRVILDQHILRRRQLQRSPIEHPHIAEQHRARRLRRCRLLRNSRHAHRQRNHDHGNRGHPAHRASLFQVRL